MSNKQDLTVPSRREFLASTGAMTLSAAGILLLAGHDAPAQSMGGTMPADVDILNVALSLEHEAIGAYQLGAQSGLLQKPVLDLAMKFQGDHRGHRDVLVATIRKLGGTPVAEKKLDEYAHALKAATLESQADVLALAAAAAAQAPGDATRGHEHRDSPASPVTRSTRAASARRIAAAAAARPGALRIVTTRRRSRRRRSPRS